jgi:hypothetical protein
MIEFEASYRKELLNRLPLVYFFARKRVIDIDKNDSSTVVHDPNSNVANKRRTTAFRKPITKIEL